MREVVVIAVARRCSCLQAKGGSNTDETELAVVLFDRAFVDKGTKSGAHTEPRSMHLGFDRHPRPFAPPHKIQSNPQVLPMKPVGKSVRRVLCYAVCM